MTLGVPKRPGASKPVQRNPSQHYESPAYLDLDTMMKQMELETKGHPVLSYMTLLVPVMMVLVRFVFSGTKSRRKWN